MTSALALPAYTSREMAAIHTLDQFPRQQGTGDPETWTTYSAPNTNTVAKPAFCALGSLTSQMILSGDNHIIKSVKMLTAPMPLCKLE